MPRDANGQPGGVLYRFGQGWVFATTMYDDWGVANGQYANDLRVTVAFVGWTPTILIGADFTEETKRALAGT